jgi:hypothetical protein
MGGPRLRPTPSQRENGSAQLVSITVVDPPGLSEKSTKFRDQFSRVQKWAARSTQSRIGQGTRRPASRPIFTDIKSISYEHLLLSSSRKIKLYFGSFVFATSKPDNHSFPFFRYDRFCFPLDSLYWPILSEFQ